MLSSARTSLSSVCSLHKSTCFTFVYWFFFNVQFFAFTFTFNQLKWEVKFVPSRQFGGSHQVWGREKRATWTGKSQRVFHSIRRSKLLIFITRKGVICVVLQNAIVYCMHMYVSSCVIVLFGFLHFLGSENCCCGVDGSKPYKYNQQSWSAVRDEKDRKTRGAQL